MEEHNLKSQEGDDECHSRKNKRVLRINTPYGLGLFEPENKRKVCGRTHIKEETLRSEPQCWKKTIFEMACTDCCYVGKNKYKTDPAVFLEMYEEIEKIKGYFEKADGCFDESSVLIRKIIAIFSLIVIRFTCRMMSLKEVKESLGEEEVMANWEMTEEKGLIPKNDQCASQKISNQYFRLEYLGSCIQTYFMVKGKSFPEGKHPFLIGGIPLSEMTRRNLRGVLVRKAGRCSIIPLFTGEGERLKLREPLPDDCYLYRTGAPCTCGSTRTNLSNQYYKEKISQLWPLEDIGEKKSREKEEEEKEEKL